MDIPTFESSSEYIKRFMRTKNDPIRFRFLGQSMTPKTRRIEKQRFWKNE